LPQGRFNNNINNYITGVFTAFGQGVSENIPTSNLQGVEFQSMFDAKVFAGLSYTYTHTNLPSRLNGLGAQSYTPEHMAGQGDCASSIRS
jgi:hemoglobin/transferrin/lactoferrin receptor protein